MNATSVSYRRVEQHVVVTDQHLVSSLPPEGIADGVRRFGGSGSFTALVDDSLTSASRGVSVFSRRRRSAHALAAALLALFVLIPAVGDAGQDVARARAGDLSGIQIDNLGQVNANYYRGAAPDDQEVANLAAFGIKTVVDLRKDDIDSKERLLVERAGMKYVHIPMTTHEPPTRAVIEQFLGIVDYPENQPVYVHCVRGRHRTGIMTAIYRMTREGWTPHRAFKEMKAYKFGADFLHPEFKRFVLGYRPDPFIARSIGVTAGDASAKR